MMVKVIRTSNLDLPYYDPADGCCYDTKKGSTDAPPLPDLKNEVVNSADYGDDVEDSDNFAW